MNDVSKLEQKAVELLDTAGFSTLVTSLTPCTRGGNNRTFILETPEQRFALKEYFRKPDDKRDRLYSEYAFLQYAQKAAPKMVPAAYARDEEAGLALYEFIEGKAIEAGDLEKRDVFKAAEFFIALNDHPGRSRDPLPNASEACFSIAEHLALVDERVSRLAQIQIEADIDEMAHIFIKELQRQWSAVKDGVISSAKQDDLSLDAELVPENRCISPSDFGFHNALKREDGTICFLDFEYAGWDDPAKMVGDFFAQLAVPIPGKYFKAFTSEVMRPFCDADMLERRAVILKNVYQIKWCCIAMNVFIPVHLERRKFANPQLDAISLKTNQLAKAQTLIKRLEMSSYV